MVVTSHPSCLSLLWLYSIILVIVLVLFVLWSIWHVAESNERGWFARGEERVVQGRTAGQGVEELLDYTRLQRPLQEKLVPVKLTLGICYVYPELSKRAKLFLVLGIPIRSVSICHAPRIVVRTASARLVDLAVDVRWRVGRGGCQGVES